MNDGQIRAWDGHGSPSSAEKGEGDIPYIRASDIVNWELYRNPTSGVDEDTYERLTRNKPPVKSGDVIFVRRGSYRIGTVAMVSPRDRGVLMMRELLTLRVASNNDLGITVKSGDVIFVRRGSYRIGTVAMVSPRDRGVLMMRELLTLRVASNNDLGITGREDPHYLMALLSSSVVQKQIRRLTFFDTTLPNIGDRWRELRLPLHREKDEMDSMNETVKRAIDQKWAAQSKIEELRHEIGGIVT